MKLTGLISLITSVVSGVKRVGTATANTLDPSKQIQAVGGRRVWLSVALTLLSMVFVIVAKLLGVSETLTLAALSVAGATGVSFVVGQSVVDNNKEKKTS